MNVSSALVSAIQCIGGTNCPGQYASSETVSWLSGSPSQRGLARGAETLWQVRSGGSQLHDPWSKIKCPETVVILFGSGPFSPELVIKYQVSKIHQSPCYFKYKSTSSSGLRLSVRMWLQTYYLTSPSIILLSHHLDAVCYTFLSVSGVFSNLQDTTTLGYPQAVQYLQVSVRRYLLLKSVTSMSNIINKLQDTAIKEAEKDVVFEEVRVASLRHFRWKVNGFGILLGFQTSQKACS